MNEYAARLASLRKALKGVPLYVSALVNVRYLTGFTGSAGHLLVEDDRAALFTDSRYETQAAEQTSGLELEITLGDSRPAFAAAVGKRRIERLGFEQNRLDYASFRFLEEKLPGCRLAPIDGAVEKLRLVKSAAEIEAIRRSIELNSRAFEQACRRLRPSWTEQRLAAEIEFAMRRLGAEGAAFPTIVAGGPRGALPHAAPQAAKLEPKSLIVVDQGAILDGYNSDMTRMISLGLPDGRQMQLFNAVREAQQAAIDAVRPGVERRTIDRRARQVLRKSKVDGKRLDELFAHSTGHGLGLEIHESPRLAPKQRKRLQAGMVVTIEPGVYLPGAAGVRIEDVVAVTPGGCEVLTPTPRELRVIE